MICKIMEQHTDTIKNRETQDRYFADMCEKYLLGTHLSGDDTSADITGQTIIALRYILQRFDQKIPRVSRCGSIQEVFDRMLEPAGILYEQFEASAVYKSRGNDCILAYTEDGLAVVILPALFGRRVYIPSQDKYERFSKKVKLKGHAYRINRPIPAENFSLGSFTGYVLNLISIRDWLLIGAVSLCISLLGVAIPEINRLVLGTYVRMPLQSVRTLLLIACAEMAVVFVFRSFFRFAKEITLSSIRLRNEIKVESAFMARILLLPMQYFRQNSSGKISSNIFFSKKLSNIVTGAIVGTSVTALFSLIYVGEISAFSGRLLAVTLLVSAVKLIAVVLTNKAEVKNRRKLTENDSMLRDYNYSTFKGIQKLKTSGAENRAYVRWALLFYTKMQLMFDPPVIVKLKSVLRVSLSAAGTILLLLAASMSELSAAEYIAFVSVYELFDLVIEQIADISEKIAAATPYVERLKPILDASCQHANAQSDYVYSLSGSVHFDRVSMRYEENEGFQLDDISLRIRSGEKVAIVGPSGCGKSSLLSLITGLNTPSSGEVFIDGKAIRRMDQHSLCRQIGSVSQFSRLFPGTIRFNISIGNEALTDEEIWKALDDAAIGDVVRKFPLGLDTEISESQSGGFAGGQRQRLLLARSFASHHRIILLDEATSALDNATQQKVLSSVFALDATVIMVAHRLSTIRQCSRIFVMDQGRIVEEGNYEALMAKKGHFFALVEKQLAENGRTKRGG